MRTLRIVLIGGLFAAVLAVTGCHTESTKRTEEVHRAGGATKVTRTETRKTDKGTETKTDVKKYHD